jgi:hypothetical protein
MKFKALHLIKKIVWRDCRVYRRTPAYIEALWQMRMHRRTFACSEALCLITHGLNTTPLYLDNPAFVFLPKFAS